MFSKTSFSIGLGYVLCLAGTLLVGRSINMADALNATDESHTLILYILLGGFLVIGGVSLLLRGLSKLRKEQQFATKIRRDSGDADRIV